MFAKPFAINFVVLFSLQLSTFASRFLFITPNSFYSHLEYAGRLADILVDAGHEVDFIIPLVNHFITTNGTKKANVSRVALQHTDELNELMIGMKWLNDVFEYNGDPHEPEKMAQIYATYCENILLQVDLLNQLRDRNYSAGFGEFIDPCAFGLFHHLAIPITHQLSALPLLDFSAILHGIPRDLNHISDAFDEQQLQPTSNLWKRGRNWIHYLATQYVLSLQPPIHKVMQRMVSPDFPENKELMAQSAYVWLNTNEFLDFPISLPAKIKQIGGVGINQPKKMDKIFASIYGRPSKGVVLVSFGSVVNTNHMKPRIRDAFLKAFAQFSDYEFIWKVSDVKGANLSQLTSNKYTNVHPVQWMDQPTILAHPQTVAFISHMGLNSLNEAAYYASPLIAIPFISDQHYNTATMLRRGFGVYVDRLELTTDSLVDALRSVLEDPKYRRVAQEVSRKMKQTPFAPAEIFVRYVEFSARNGPMAELRLPASKINFIQTHSLDLLAILLFIVFSIVLVFIGILTLFIRLYSRLTTENSTEKQKKTL